MNQTAKLIAAVGVTLEHVERGRARRKQDHITHFRGRVRPFYRIRQRARDFASRYSMPVFGNSLRHLTEKNGGVHFFFHDVAQRLKIEALVLPARD